MKSLETRQGIFMRLKRWRFRLASRPADRAVGIVETKYFSFVDGLRGLAILIVLVFHAAWASPLPLTSLGAQRLVFAGERGVDLFFIVSAFTLFSSSLQRFPNERHPFRNFYVRRAFRILPLWWLSLGFYYLMPDTAIMIGGTRGLSTEVPSLGPLLLRASFLFGFVPSLIKSSLNPGGWSLFVEETFYIFLPLIVARVRSMDAAVRLLFALLALSIAWHYVGMAWLGSTPTGSNFVAWFPFFRWYAFALGIILYFLFSRWGSGLIPASLTWTLDAMAGLFYVVASQAATGGLAFFGGTFALGLLALSCSQRASLWRLMLDTGPMRLLGRCSYSIYLFHVGIRDALQGPVLNLFQWSGIATHPNLALPVWSAILTAGSLAFGVLSFTLMEKPLVRLGKVVIAYLERSPSPPAGE